MFEGIDFKSKEENSEVRRPFVINLEESVARSFIKTCKDNGLFVRETLMKLMKEFSKNYNGEGNAKD